MNLLNKQIEVGEVVVVKASFYVDELTLEQRLFVCESGFGMSHLTAGRAIFGHWLDGSGEDRIDGDMISKEETEMYQESKK